MKPDKLLAELEEVTEKLGYRIRREKGRFRGDACILEGDRIVMVNKSHPPEANIGVLSRFLAEQDLESIHIKPAVRKHLETFGEKSRIRQESQNREV